MPLTILGVIFGYLGMKKPTGRGMAIAGMVCGIIGTAIAAWWVYAYITVKNAAEDGAKQLEQDIQNKAKEQANQPAAPTPTP